MAIVSSFFDGTSVNAAMLMGIVGDMLTDGVFTAGSLAVGANSPAGLSVVMAPGTAVKTPYRIASDANEVVSIAANTSGYNRIDLIVLEVNATTKATTPKAIQGVPSSSPVAPTAGALQLSLAQVLVGNNASALNANVITDVRRLATLQPPAQIDGWTRIIDPWTYASISGVVATVTVPSGTAAKYKGAKIKLTQSSTVKYGYVIGGSGTSMLLAMDKDALLVNAPITDVYYSRSDCPEGHPGWLNYTSTITGMDAMTYSGYTLNFARYRVIAGALEVQIRAVNGTTGGTASWALIASLPVTTVYSNVYGVGAAQDGVSSLIAGVAYSASGSVYVRKGDLTNYGLGGTRGLTFSITLPMTG